MGRLAHRLDPAAAGPGVVLDLAGGTGYYLAAVLATLPGRTGICLDLSKPALRKAARAHSRAVAVGSDVWRRFPLADRSAAVVLSVFGPRNMAETIRVLDPAGIFLLVTPDSQHLAGLVGDAWHAQRGPRQSQAGWRRPPRASGRWPGKR